MNRADDAHWPESVDGERVALRRIGVPVQADWLPEAAQAVAGRAEPCRLEDSLARGDTGWWIVGDSEAVGALSGRLEDTALVWTWLAIDARWRAYGFGGASVPLFEEAARQLGADEALVPLPPDNGVALYFWLRLGYTPLREAPPEPLTTLVGAPADAVWMRRTFESDSTESTEGA